MEITQAIAERHSVRNYQERRVTDDVLIKLMEMVRLAPSAVNFQPWHFIILTEEEALERIRPVYHRAWFKAAPVVIVACLDRSLSWKRGSDGHDYGEVDLAIAVDHLTLAAVDLGLGTCWVCNFDAAACKQALALPESLDPLVLVPLGYPEGNIPEKKRKPLTEIISWQSYRQTKY